MHIKSVCIFCSSANTSPEPYRTLAREVSTALAKRNLTVVYGGGRVGLMGIVADSALAAGAKVVGIIPHSLREREYQHDGLTELHIVPDLHSRKRMMVERSDAFLVLPGAMGTLDETFDVLTWKRLKLHSKPVLIYNHKNYWDALLTLIDHTIDEKLAQPRDRGLFDVVTNVEEMFAALAKAPAPVPSTTEIM